MGKVIMVEGGPPSGMPIGDPNYPLQNTLPEEVKHPGFTPDLNVRRKVVIGENVKVDVTPEILKGIEHWIMVKGHINATLTRLYPPADPNDPYAHQTVTPEQAGVIHTPPDIVAAYPYEPSYPTRKPLFPVRKPMACIAAMFWYQPENDTDGQDRSIAEPPSGTFLPKKDEVLVG